jgi:ribosomal protein S18 acetylase RimI-like enzyme
MTLRTAPIIEHPIPTLVETANRAFTGYLAGTPHFTPASIAGMVAQLGIDLGHSQLALVDGRVIGFGFIARRGTASRLAAFGIVPEAQGQGWGKHFMQQLIEQAGRRGDQRMVLEVFEQNTPAVKLYEGLGFRSERRLMGYEGQQLSGEAGALEPIPILTPGRRVTQWGDDNLPWQCSGETLMKYTPPYAAYALGESCVLISDPGAEQIAIRGVAVPVDQQRQGMGTRLIRALVAAFPGKKWVVPQLCPEAFGGLFLRNGFTVLPLNQLQMTLPVPC